MSDTFTKGQFYKGIIGKNVISYNSFVKVWYLIVLNPDLCTLTYFHGKKNLRAAIIFYIHIHVITGFAQA